MKPSSIYLIRHGQSEGNVNREIHATVPDHRVPLTDKGIEQAIGVGFTLAEDNPSTSWGVYTSIYQRARHTTDLVANELRARHDVRWIKEDPRLVEQNWGNLRAYESRAWGDVEKERDDYGTLFYRFLHGESGLDVWHRCSDFLDTLHRDFAKPDFPDKVLISTHGFTLRVFLMRWFHWTPEEFATLRNPRNGQVFEMRLGAGDKYYLATPMEKQEGPRTHE